MKKLEIKLKQHTPIIHFQGEQDGATIRASELKPKLDKYLVEMVFDEEFDKLKTYLTGYKKEREENLRRQFLSGYSAFDYKVSVSTEGSLIKSEAIPPKFPCYFGDMGEENRSQPKAFSFADNPLQVTFSTDHPSLIDSLKRELPNFLARNNFGTRQSKGFGSFYVHENDPLYEPPLLFSHFTSNASRKEFQKLFEDVDTVHKVIRSGINDKGKGNVGLFYMKPLIWQYFRKKAISWEKREIKQEFFNEALNGQVKYHERETEDGPDNWPLFYQSREHRMVKDLLGLSSSENWYSYKATIKKESASIDRLKSPFFYKPIFVGDGFRVYIGFDHFNPDFLNHEFKITNGTSSFSIKTPDEFDIDNFFLWCFSQTNISNFIAHKYQDTPKAKRIGRMFNELKKNLNG